MSETLPQELRRKAENCYGFDKPVLAKAMERAADEIERLRAALGHCPNTTDGKHVWAMFPVGTDGHIATAPQNAYGAAGVFCQNCMMPKSPYHEDGAHQQQPSQEPK